ncbi:hypothetical protein BY458DRAFT_430474 [Sporodiniella umbellata]|nr:hypothetical protein BY458DRAFT_430474 [Sporodiniella umbellata]
MVKATKKRNYQLYVGKTIFFCGGRLLTSQALWAFTVSCVLTLVPAVLFLVFTCPWLWHELSPVVPIVFGYLLTLSLASMLKASWTDPGIIPRNLDRESLPQEPFGYPYSSVSNQSLVPSPKYVTIKGLSVRLKYCETCCIYRPPRASHCKQCDNCICLDTMTIENEDHHCIWLNNCLTPVSFFDALFCLLLLFPISCLTGYHFFLMMRGVTTHEQLRSNFASSPFEAHPFDFGNPFTNMLHILCRPHNKR